MHHQANFNRIARPYRFLEYLTLGPALQRCRTHFLLRLRDRRHALVLGDGDGRFLVRLLADNPELRADAVDTSAVMLDLLRRRCEGVTRIRLRTHNHSALEHAPSAGTDLVVAHFFLDCLTQAEVDALVPRLVRHIRRDAVWLISDFRVPSGALHLPARWLVRSLYLAFRLLTGLRTTRLPDYEGPLQEAGLVCIARHHTLMGLLTTALWQKMNPEAL